MSWIGRDGHRVSFKDEGQRDGEAVFFCHSLGLDASSWRSERDRLSDRWRTVRVDMRGHGASDAPAAPYSAADLAGDVLAVADHLEIECFHFVGISLGGLVAMWTAIHHPQRLRSAILASTGAKLGDASLWDARIAAVEAGAMAAIADAVVERFFAPGFAQRQPGIFADARSRLAACDPQGYIGCCYALRDEDLRDRLAEIALPVLVIGSRHDVATPPQMAKQLQAAIDGSQLLILDDAGHISNLEQPEPFAAALDDFFSRQALPRSPPTAPTP